MTEAMGNFKVHVIARSPEALRLAVGLACREAPKAVAWSRQGEWFVLHWSHNQSKAGVSAFPVAHGLEEIVGLVTAWLGDNPPHEKEPDIDGSVSKGFELVVSRGDVWSCEMLRVRSVWALHGK